MTSIKLEDCFLECPVCFEKFDETCKMLQCQHTFCTNCLKKIIEGKLLCCPVCRRSYNNVEIDELPPNLFLSSLVENLCNKSSIINNNSDSNEYNEDKILEETLTLSLKEFNENLSKLIDEELEINEAKNRSLISEKERLELGLVLLESEKVEMERKIVQEKQDEQLASVLSVQSYPDSIIIKSQNISDTLLKSLKSDNGEVLSALENLSINQELSAAYSSHLILHTTKKLEVLDLIKQRNSIDTELEKISKKELHYLNNAENLNELECSIYSAVNENETDNVLQNHLDDDDEGISYVLRKTEILAKLEKERSEFIKKKEDLELNIAILMSELK